MNIEKRTLVLLPWIAIGLCTLALVAPNALAGGDSTPGTSKVIAAPGVLDPAGDGITLWHDYGAFALYRVSDAALGRLAPEILERVTVLDGRDRLLLRTVDSEAPPGAETAVQDGPRFHLVQFVGPIKPEWLGEVEATGARAIQYIANYGYLLWADPQSVELIDKMADEGIILERSVPYATSLKIGPSLTARLEGTADPAELVTVVVQEYRSKLQEQTAALLAQLSVGGAPGWTPVLAYRNTAVTVHLSDVWQIAAQPDVFWIEERNERHLTDEVLGQIVAGNLDGTGAGPSGPGYLAWLNALGFSTDPSQYPIVDFADDGIGNGTVNSGDPTLHQFGDAANPTRLAYVANCTSAADGSGPDGHGHLNVSIAGGYDTTSGFPFQDALGYQRGLGISPYGRFAGTRVFATGFDQSACGGTDAGVIRSIQDSGAKISNNSWGCSGCAGSYDDSSQAYDAGARDADPTEPGNQPMIFVFTAGNSGPSAGTVNTPGNGKNVITVGGSENQRPTDEDGAWSDGCAIGPTGADDAMDVIGFSSRGPAPGGRVKPEIVAPSTHVTGTASTNAGYTGNSVCDQYRPSGQTVFAASSGTSHSTAAVSGVASLAYWWMENTYGLAPSPALMKAYLVAHPTYLTGAGANDTLPSYAQGFGMPDMTSMFDGSPKFLLDQSVVFDNSGETWTWTGGAADPTKPVRIVLVYTDAPGAVGTTPQVNDLNLAADVDGVPYHGNVFSGEWSVTGGTADPANNVEAIFLPAGAAGAIEITVTAFNVGGDGVPNTGDATDQDFALVCYNCQQTPDFTVGASPELVEICAPDDAIYDVAIGQILGFTDPVTLAAAGHPAGTTAGFSVNPVVPPGNSVLTIGGTGAAAADSYVVDVIGTSTTGSKMRSVELDLYDSVPLSPILVAPSDGEINVSFKPALAWAAVPQAKEYLVEVATDPGFVNIVYAASETGTSHSLAIALSAATTHYWRVTSENPCGSAASVTFSFTTQTATMLCNTPAVDFEDGIPADWTVIDNTGGTGIVWTTTADPACEIPNRTNGTGEAACADSDAAGSGAPPYDTELVSNPFDLSGAGAATLDVKAYYNDITTSGNDRFEVDIWNGTTWTNLVTWDEDHVPEDIHLNLSAYIGLPVVQVRFRYSGNGYDWYAQADDVELTCAPPSDPVIGVAPASLASMQGPGVVKVESLAISNTGGSPLDWNIVEDDTACDSPVDIPWLSVAPDAGTIAPLDGASVDVTFDSTGLVSGSYSANLCVNSNDPAQPIVQVPVDLTVLPPTGLTCNGPPVDFEDGIPNTWQVIDNTGGTGIVWTTTADPACEVPNRTNGTGEAACADSDAAGSPAIPYDTELWSNLLDFSAVGAAVLDVKAYYNDITTGSNDRFEIDVWDGAGWTNELRWDEDHMPEDIHLNLSAYGGLPGVRVRFRYSGNGYDWYAQVDDVALSCVGATPPIVDVSPASLASEQGPDTVRAETLTVANAGGSPLNWSIVEDDSACDSPADVPWLSTSPDTGAVMPLGSAAVDVTFDSTGLIPGPYTASLCVASDDPVTPMVEVPITLTVLPPEVLSCDGPPIHFDAGIPSGWPVIDNAGNGLVWSDIAGAGEAGNYTGGGGNAATASSDAFGRSPYDTELRTAAFDLAGWLPSDTITLRYLANYQNYAGRDRLDLDVSTDDGASWVNLLSWNEDHGPFRNPPGEAVAIDLTPYAGMSGLRLRWRWYDLLSTAYDWYAQIDELSLDCVPSPVIGVSPASLSSQQVPGQTTTHLLTIGNLGGADLDWTIHEDEPAAIVQPADLGAAEAREAPATPGWAAERYRVRPQAVLLSEGFEGGLMPPMYWTQVLNNLSYSWRLKTTAPYSGLYAADIVYDPGLIPQDEWLLSPELSIAEGTLSLWSFGSLYWCRDTYDNCDLDVWLVVGDVGGGDDVYVGRADNDWSATYTWSQSVFDLTPLLPGGPVRLGFQYTGLDGAQVALDEITLDGTLSGACFSPQDVSWMSADAAIGTTPPGGGTGIGVLLDATGMPLGTHEGVLCIESNDAATPLVTVPVTMEVMPFEIAVTKTALTSGVFEPGGDVDFQLEVMNPSLVDATIDALGDSEFDVSPGCAGAPGTTLAPGETYTCTFTGYVDGNASVLHFNQATVAASDAFGNSFTATDDESVLLLDADPVISVVKTGPQYVLPGGTATFFLTIYNESVLTDPVSIQSIVDDIYGDVTLLGTCAAYTVIAAGDSYICQFTVSIPPDLVGTQTDVVTVVAVDDEANHVSENGQWTVTVNHPPVAVAGMDATVECTSPAGAVATLDGSASYDVDSTPGTNDDIILFEWFEDFGTPSEVALGSGVVLSAPLALGTHAITLRVTDQAGATDTDPILVHIVDTTPPELSVALTPNLLWPPNHRMMEVTAVVAAVDLCGPAVVILQSLESSEPDDAVGNGDGATTDDIQGGDLGTADLLFQLRAERAGSGPGRTYTAIYSATDNAGNTAMESAIVLVPHDKDGIVEPVVLQVSENGSGTLVSWDAVPGASFYNVVRGNVADLQDTGTAFDLGGVTCVAAATTGTSLAGAEDADPPEPGGIFFYVVEYDDGKPSSYGSGSAVKPRTVGNGSGCR